MTLTAAQQQIRAKGIGASETPAILGLDRYRSPIDIYLKKLGLVEDTETFHTERGVYLEDGLRRWASKRTGLNFERSESLVHPEHQRILATPDGVAMDGNRVVAVLELKSPGFRMRDEWGDGDEDAPDNYVVQLEQQMMVTGAPVGFLGAFVDDDLHLYRFERDRDLDSVIAERINYFWREYIEKQTPPPADGTESHKEWLGRRFPRSSGKMLEPTAADAELLQALKRAQEASKAAEAEVELLKQQLKERIGDAQGIDVPGLGKATWKNNQDTRWVDWQAIATFLGANKEHEIKFTKTKAGPRVFRTHFPKESK
jgi:putative phage-type endonuclease